MPQYLSQVLSITTKLGISSCEIYLTNEDIFRQVSVKSLIKRARKKQISEEQAHIVSKNIPGY